LYRRAPINPDMQWLGIQFFLGSISDKLILAKAEIKQVKKKSSIKNLIRRVKDKTKSLFLCTQINNIYYYFIGDCYNMA